MSETEPDITPAVTVHKLLEAYPQLEEVLIGIAPPFKKLRNPILRRSVAKVATLRHAAAVGRVPLNELIATLRSAVGQAVSEESYEDGSYFREQPDWFAAQSIALTIEEAKLANQDEMTLGPVLRGAKSLKRGEIIELVTTFLPAPGIDVMKRKGYAIWVVQDADDVIRTYFLKQRD
jgi:hypothetical protein